MMDVGIAWRIEMFFDVLKDGAMLRLIMEGPFISIPERYGVIRDPLEFMNLEIKPC